MRAATAPTPEIVARAAHWAALLDDERVSQRVQEACERWCCEDPRNRLALERMRGLAGRFDRLDGAERAALGMATKGRSLSGRRPAMVALGLLLLLVGAGWLSASPWLAPLFPDHQTGRGERRSLVLSDGSALILDGGSAADVDMASAERRVTLFRGQVQATVSPDAARPFTVATVDGTATALGTAFIVRKEGGRTLVTVVESRVRVCGQANPADCRQLTAGQRAMVTQAGVTPLSDVDPRAATAWTRGWLEADDMPVADLLAELNRQRGRPIRCDASLLNGRRVTGSFPLDDTDRAAQALAAATGLRLTRDSQGDLLLSANR